MMASGHVEFANDNTQWERKPVGEIGKRRAGEMLAARRKQIREQ